MNFLYKTCIFLLLFLFIWEVPAYSQINIKPNTEHHYTIKSGNTVIGYSVYKAGSQMQLAGDKFVKYRSLAVIRAGIGNVSESIFQTDFSISTQTGRPSYLLMQQTSGGRDMISETVYSDDVIAQKNAVGEQVFSSITETNKTCYLFTSNLWGRLDSFPEHYDILIKSSGEAKETKFDVYDPILKTEGTLTLTRGAKIDFEFKGAQKKAVLYTLSDYYCNPLVKIWYDTEGGKIYKMEEAGGKITFELSNIKAADELKKSHGADIGIDRTAISPVYLQSPEKLKMTSITGTVSGRGLTSQPHEVLGFKQSFTGETTDNTLTGTFVIKKEPLQIDKPNRFPPFKLDESLNKYLLPQTGIESSNDYIVNKAQEITWKSRDCRTAAGKICRWINENIKTGISMPSALLTFNMGIGNPESKAMLMTAMCRAAGIPSRMAGGIVFDKGSFIPGYWTEVYIENSGWLPFDTTKGEEGIDTARAYLYEFGDVTKIALENVDYLPKLPKRVPFHQKDISWPVGEVRTYEIKIGDRLIGKERAMIADMTFGEQGESYLFNSEVIMNLAGSKFTAKASASFDIQALPLYFESSSGIGEALTEQKFRFTNKVIEKILSVDNEGNEIKLNIPYSKGTYLLDNKYLSLWVLAAGQIPRIELGGKYKFTSFLPDDMKTMEIELEAKGFERVEAEGKDVNAFKCEDKTGMIFYIEPSGKVLKISIPAQNLEFTLLTTDILTDEPLEPLTVDIPAENEEEGTEVKATENEKPEGTEVKATENEKPEGTEVKATENETPEGTEVKATENEKPEGTEVKTTENEEPEGTEVKATKNEKPEGTEVKKSEDKKAENGNNLQPAI